MIIQTSGREIQAQQINILTTALSLFALHYLGISGDLTEVLPTPTVPSECQAFGIYTILISKEGALLEELPFPPLISGLMGRPLFRDTLISVGALQDIFGIDLYWFQVHARSKLLRVGKRIWI